MNITEFQKRVSEADRPIVIDFRAQWCMPCKITKPILEKLAKEYNDKIEFIPIDADVSHDILEEFKIIGIPTVLSIRNGEVIARVTGAQNESSYRAIFNSLAEGREVKVPLSPLTRTLRLGAGALLIISGISLGNWLVAVFGSIIAFLGVYDRCPIWKAITRMFKQHFLKNKSQLE